MNLKKKAVSGVIVAGSLALMCTIADAAPAKAYLTDTEVSLVEDTDVVKEKKTSDAGQDTNGMAGVVICLNQVETGAMSYLESASITVERSANDVVASAEEAETSEETEVLAEEDAEVSEEAESSEEEAAWQNRLMADVDEYLNIRAAADENSEAIGKLYKGDVAESVEQGEEWTHIRSGNADGYVKNDYCVVGMDAYAYAKANVDATAELTTDALRVRSEANTDASVLTTAYAGTNLTVDTDAEAVDGWVAVECGGQTGYVSAEYVTTELDLGEAVTIEEEQAEQRRLAEEEAARKAAQTTEVTTVQNTSVAASADDVTLLAAIIQCEAGSECYEGQVAVGAVVMNRLRSGSYPSTIYDVIYQKGQFTPAGSGSVAKVIANGPSATCVQAAQEALNGTDNTGGAVSFCRASSGHAGVVIGNHVFY